jgi:hypothetical protein
VKFEHKKRDTSSSSGSSAYVKVLDRMKGQLKKELIIASERSY